MVPRRKGTTVVSGQYPFKRYVFVPNECLNTSKVPKVYISVPKSAKCYILEPFLKGSFPVTAFVPFFLRV